MALKIEAVIGKYGEQVEVTKDEKAKISAALKRTVESLGYEAFIITTTDVEGWHIPVKRGYDYTVQKDDYGKTIRFKIFGR